MHSHILSYTTCCSSICLLMGEHADPCNSMGKFEDARSIMIINRYAAGNLLEVQTMQNKFNKLQEKLYKTNVAKCKATQAAQKWHKTCLAARAHNNLLTQENHQLKQEHQKLGDWLARTADVPKHPKQPAGAQP